MTTNIATDAPTRPALRYYGGKWNLAPWIIGHFPPHKNYVEPCGGAASVLLQKPRCPLETYNDLDGNVVNFFRVLRDRPDELIQKIRLTPWARAEHQMCLTIAGDELERARRYFVMIWQSLNGATDNDANAWRSMYDYEARQRSAAMDGIEIEHLYAVARRLQYVQIECMPAEEVIKKYDNPNALIYFDPPYPTTTRVQGRRYLYEWTNDQHTSAAKQLHDCSGYVIVSGYQCPLYEWLYQGWPRKDRESQVNGGRSRIESIWLSPRTWAALQAGAGLPLFGGLS